MTVKEHKDKSKSFRNAMLALLAFCLVSLAAVSYMLYDTRKSLHRLENQQTSTSLPLLSQPNSPKASSNPADDWNPWLDPWDPSGQFQDLQNRMNQLMSSMMPNGSFFSQQGFGLSPVSPSVVMEETKDHLEVKITAPEGQDMEFNAEIADGQLRVFGKVKNITENQSGQSFEQSVATSQFSQVLTLPESVDEAGMSVTKENEQFVVKIPKRLS